MEIKQTALMLGIAILSTILIFSIIELFYKQPKFEDFCQKEFFRAPRPLEEEDRCEGVRDFTKENECLEDSGSPRFKLDENGCQVFDYCDFCQKDHDEARKNYQRNLFFIAAPIGIILVFLGIFLTPAFIGSGFMFAGLATLFFSTITYFREMSDWLRVLVLLIEIGILILIGYKKLINKKERK